MTTPDPISRRSFISAAGAGWLLLLGPALGVSAACSDQEVAAIDPLRHWRDLATPDVLALGQSVAAVDPDAAIHAVFALVETPDSDDPTVAARALADACATDVANGAFVLVDSWTLPRTLGGLAAALAVAE